METKHTPGPWSADKWATGYTVSAPESHYSICHLEDCNNADANAHLIAAAPIMLERIQELIDAASAVSDAWDSGDLAAAVNELNEVVAQAKEDIKDFS